MFTHLHVHSDHSLFDGYQTIDEIVEKVKAMGQRSVAITEHGTMKSILNFYLKCKSEGIKPILGCEFYFCDDKTIKEREFTHHLILLAKNKIGYYNLKKLNKMAYDKEAGNFYFKPRIDSHELVEYSDGIICLSACLASIVNTPDGEKWVQYFKNIFKDDFYLEIQPHPMQEQEEYNKKLIEYCHKYNIKPVVTTDAHYASREDAAWHKKWIGLKKSEYYTTDTNYLWSEQEILASNFINKNIVELAIQTTQEIDNKIEFIDISIPGNHFPKFKTNNACEMIKDICRKVWKDKVPKGHYKEYGDRFLYELSMLEKCGYTNYLLLTWDFLNWCRSNNILTGVGRGSVGGSVVAWLLGIHHVDPIKYNLLFERFCNPERISSPDVDNDVQTSRRGETISYLKQKYGSVMKIITYSKLSDKSAIQRAGQSLLIEPAKIDRITKEINSINDIEHISTDFNTNELINLSKHFYGRIGAFGSHASAVLITPDDTLQYTPIEYQSVSDESLGGEKVWTKVAAGDFHVLEEEFGLMKLDVLGLNTLDVIDNVLKNIPDKVDIYNLNTNDKKVFKLYEEGNLLGCFQMDSTGMRKLAKDMKVSEFENIIALVALFRPGPLGSGLVDAYINGKNGGKITYLCKEIEEVLSPTYNVIVYQEQVMMLARKLAGYTMGQADMLRKIIGRKEEDKIEQATIDFKNAVIAHGFSHEIANYIGNQIKSAGRYIFNKSHATAYGYLSYVTAYLKVYYPKEFMCALINSKKKQDEVKKYINECKRMNIEMLPPDLRVGNLDWVVSGNAIRVGLTYIKNVGTAININYNDTFENIVEHNNKRIVEGLIKAGAIDYLQKPRNELLSQLTSTQDYLKRKVQCETKIKENKEKLFTATSEKDIKKYTRQLNLWTEKLAANELTQSKTIDDYSASAGEMEVLGFSFNAIPRIKEGTVKKIFTKQDKRGREMAWITIDSNYGEYKCTCFASNWKKWKKDIKENIEGIFAFGEDLILNDFQVK